jgi:hypothetical protein
VQALSYFIQSSGYDPSLTEAASRMNILNANISSGNIGADTRNEIEWRRQWITRLKEAETFFNNYVKNPQPYYLVYSTDIQKVNINWKNETVTLSFEMALAPEISWKNPINGVINAVKSGFLSIGKAKAWEINWPAKSVGGGTTPFISKAVKSMVVVEILNDKGTRIGRQNVTVSSGYDISEGIITVLKYWAGTVFFPEVNVNTITDTLTIRIVSIDGITAKNAAKQKNISILPMGAYQKMLADSIATNVPAERTFKIGDHGPAGGFVFYDKGQVTDGWRYLEAAPSDLQNAEWGNAAGPINTKIGFGKENTNYITMALNSKGETGKAAQLCRSSIMSGFNDWFLPSMDELVLMYKNLKQNGVGEFSDNYYWSSSQYENTYALTQRFSDGRDFKAGKNDKCSVRPIRAF